MTRKMTRKIIGRTPDGRLVREHDHMAAWSDCTGCGTRLVPETAPDGWAGECYVCGAAPQGVGLAEERYGLAARP